MKSHKEQYIGLDEKLKTQNYAGAISQIDSAKERFYKKKERVLYYLDIGMLYHYNREFQKSNEMLTKAENTMDELFTKSISRAATSILLNDNSLEYCGEDYENIYVNIFKALNYLGLDQFDEAFVEIRRIDQKLSVLEDKYKKIAKQYNRSKNKKNNFKTGKSRFQNSALGRYLSLLIYRTENKLDDARIDLNKIKEAWELQSSIYNFRMPDFDNYLTENNKVKIDFISFIGRSPEKKAKTLYIHTEDNLLIIGKTKEISSSKQELSRLDVINWKGIKKGYHFKFQLPYMIKRSSNIGKVKIFIDDKPELVLQNIESIEEVAFETYKIKEPITYLKTIT
ncbi:MAG: hypothetical protein DRJ01_18905, partial [Bacteroidetes bacterium]